MAGLLKRAYSRLDLLRKMMDQTDAKLEFDTSLVGENALHSCIANCLGCRQSETCAKWLAEDHADETVPAFCPNSATLNRMRSTTA